MGCGRVIPALFTNTATGPSWLSICLTISATWAAMETSAATAAAWPPWLLIAAQDGLRVRRVGPVVDGHSGAGSGERQGNGSADSPAAAADQGDLAVKECRGWFDDLHLWFFSNHDRSSCSRSVGVLLRL